MVKGTRDQDKLRAAEAILDRAGFPRASRIEGHLSLEESREVLLERILELRAGERPITAAPTRAVLEVVEAEVVDDDEP